MPRTGSASSSSSSSSSSLSAARNFFGGMLCAGGLALLLCWEGGTLLSSLALPVSVVGVVLGVGNGREGCGRGCEAFSLWGMQEEAKRVRGCVGAVGGSCLAMLACPAIPLMAGGVGEEGGKARFDLRALASAHERGVPHPSEPHHAPTLRHPHPTPTPQATRPYPGTGRHALCAAPHAHISLSKSPRPVALP